MKARAASRAFTFQASASQAIAGV